MAYPVIIPYELVQRNWHVARLDVLAIEVLRYGSLDLLQIGVRRVRCSY